MNVGLAQQIMLISTIGAQGGANAALQPSTGFLNVLNLFNAAQNANSSQMAGDLSVIDFYQNLQQMITEFLDQTAADLGSAPSNGDSSESGGGKRMEMISKLSNLLAKLANPADGNSKKLLQETKTAMENHDSADAVVSMVNLMGILPVASLQKLSLPDIEALLEQAKSIEEEYPITIEMGIKIVKMSEQLSQLSQKIDSYLKTYIENAADQGQTVSGKQPRLGMQEKEEILKTAYLHATGGFSDGSDFDDGKPASGPFAEETLDRPILEKSNAASGSSNTEQNASVNNRIPLAGRLNREGNTTQRAVLQIGNGIQSAGSGQETIGKPFNDLSGKALPEITQNTGQVKTTQPGGSRPNMTGEFLRETMPDSIQGTGMQQPVNTVQDPNGLPAVKNASSSHGDELHSGEIARPHSDLKTEIDPVAQAYNNTGKFEPIAISAGEKDSPVSYRKFVQEFTNMIQKAAYSNQKGTTKLLIRLEPEHLGSLRVELLEQNGRLEAKIITNTGAAKDLLDSQLQQLKEALAVQHVQLTKMDVLNRDQVTQNANSQPQMQGEQERRQPQQQKRQKAKESGRFSAVLQSNIFETEA